MRGQPEVLNFEIEINQGIKLKPKRKFLVCLKCQTRMGNKNKCEKCGTKFHDGFFVSLIKRVWGITPR